MKALVVRQPWASLIAHGVKTIETRGFAPRTVLQPGDRVAIVAGKKKAPSDPTLMHMLAEATGGSLVDAMGALWADPDKGGLPLGSVVAVVTYDEALPVVAETGAHGDELYRTVDGRDLARQTLTGDGSKAEHVHTTWLSDQLPLGDFAPGRYGWLLSNPQRINPVPCPAKAPDGTRTVMQGVFDLPAHVEAEVLRQIS